MVGVMMEGGMVPPFHLSLHMSHPNGGENTIYTLHATTTILIPNKIHGRGGMGQITNWLLLRAHNC